MSPVTVGLVARPIPARFRDRVVDPLAGPEQLDRWAAAVERSEVDHVVVTDHVSYHGGFGSDGLTTATALLSRTRRLGVQTGVYLVGLRHPAVVARQLSSLALLAPGRFTFGVGVGGDRPAEYQACGLDPRSRGARTDEALRVLGPLLRGDEVTYHGRHVQLTKALIRPTPPEPVPILVGGRARRALDRVAEFGAGWLAISVSPDRFAESTRYVAATAETVHGRPADHPWRHALQVWCGFGRDRDEGREHLVAALATSHYPDPTRVLPYCAYGTPAQVTRSLLPYLAGGCRSFNLIAYGRDAAAAIAGAEEVRARLRAPA
jgi:alkanesulfonate monooxygenase SsuD/methylene tetrahydromethanopterin reductase-like flavin-dependent oxidoreductase (luciferase family)